MTITTTRPARAGALRLGVAAFAATALTLAGTVSAVAVDSQLGPDDITPYQIGDESSSDWNYNTWHIGSNSDTAESLDTFVTFGECSISTNIDPRGAEHHVQVLKGFDLDQRPTAGLEEYGGDGTLADFQALIDSVSIDVAEGDVTLQIPVFAFDGLENEPRSAFEFTTFRSVHLGEGQHALADLELTDSQDWQFGTSWAEIFSVLEEDIEDDVYYQILGVGFASSEDAVVNSISFAGDTYYFGTGDCLDTEDDEDDEDDELPTAPRPPERVDTGR